MGVGTIECSDLDDFVAECDRLGGVESEKAKSFISDFHLRLYTKVDETLNPFSDAYVNMQIEVYKEISNKELNQVVGEQANVDVENNTKTANPYGSVDVNFIANHARAVLTSLLVSQMPKDAKILDLGCGCGLSTEMLAFCGAKVYAVDINPLYVELITRRTLRNGYDVKVFEDNFDTFKPDTLFDLVFFYECLHHSIKPWETIKHATNFR